MYLMFFFGGNSSLCYSYQGRRCEKKIHSLSSKNGGRPPSWESEPTLEHHPRTWIRGKIPMVIVSKSPRPGVVGPLPNGRFMTYKWGILTTYKSWDDAPSIRFKSGHVQVNHP